MIYNEFDKWMNERWRWWCRVLARVKDGKNKGQKWFQSLGTQTADKDVYLIYRKPNLFRSAQNKVQKRSAKRRLLTVWMENKEIAFSLTSQSFEQKGLFPFCRGLFRQKINSKREWEITQTKGVKHCLKEIREKKKHKKWSVDQKIAEEHESMDFFWNQWSIANRILSHRSSTWVENSIFKVTPVDNFIEKENTHRLIRNDLMHKIQTNKKQTVHK